MEDVASAIALQHVELDDLLTALDPARWSTPSPRCPGWTISDVVLHLAQTDEMAVASLRGRFDETLERFSGGLVATSVEDGAGAMVASERGAPPADVHDRWRAMASEVRAAYAEVDPSTRVPWVAGDMAARTLLSTRLAECWVHTGDVHDALGQPIVSSKRLWHIARLAWRTLPYAFVRAGHELSGPVRFDLRGPAGEVWDLAPDGQAVTTITGNALDLCQVAGQRAAAADTGLTGSGLDAHAVLTLVRTFA